MLSRNFCLAAALLRRSVWILLLAGLAGLTACRQQTPEELMQEANQLVQSRDILAAEVKYEEVLEKHPESELAVAARVNLAYCYMLEGDFERARELLDVAIDQAGGVTTPEGLQFFLMKMQTYNEGKQPERALAELLETSPTLAQMPPENQDMFRFMLADQLLLNQQEDRGIAVLQEILATGPSQLERHMQPLERIVQVYTAREELDKAVQTYQDYLERYPESPFRASLLTGIGFMQQQQGQTEAAEEAFRRSETEFQQQLETTPGAEGKSVILMQLARLEQMRENPEAQRDYLQRIIEEHPMTPQRLQAEQELVMQAIGAGEPDRAIEHLESIATNFADTPMAAEATQLIAQIRSDMETSPTLFTRTTDTLNRRAATTTGTLTTTDSELALTTGTIMLPTGSLAEPMTPPVDQERVEERLTTATVEMPGSPEEAAAEPAETP